MPIAIKPHFHKLLYQNVKGLTVGVARGQDQTFTKGTDGSMYEGKPWTGSIDGIDLIKEI